MDAWREILYPLGYLASLAFGARFFIQWITSEIKQESVVTRAFWRFSLVGNLLLLIHTFLQLQYHICIIQACNAVISWRNLNLMGSKYEQWKFRSVIKLFIVSILAITIGFILQGYILRNGVIEWFRMPTPNLDDFPPRHIGLFWHLIGFLALALFSSRFWVQWWFAEQNKQSTLGIPFWWLSISGGILTLIYFIRIEDPVNIIGPAFGLIPYIRNLMLIYKPKLQTVS